MHPLLGSLLLQAAGQASPIREGLRTKPAKDSAGAALDALSDAYEKRHKDLGLTVEPVVLAPGHPIESGQYGELEKNYFGGHQIVKDNTGRTGDKFFYNPNAARDILAHEMGHAVTRKTKIGKVMRNLRQNPKLAMALAAATGILPVANAALTPGDDDYDDAVAGVVALAAPTLIDEGLATKNALAMLESADMRATLGQRGRLAGALMSYVAAPMVAGTLGTAIGNQFDKDVPTV